MKCPLCKVKLKSISFYVERERIPAGQYCPICCRQYTFTNKLREYQNKLTKEQKERSKHKPKFGRLRHACPYCLQKGIENRSKWTIEKLKEDPEINPHWKCTCQKCGNIWIQNHDIEYFYIDVNLPKLIETEGAPIG